MKAEYLLCCDSPSLFTKYYPWVACWSCQSIWCEESDEDDHAEDYPLAA